MTPDTWTIAHDLALTLLAVVAREGPELQDYELAAVTDSLQDWPPGMSPDQAQDVVMEVLSYGADASQMHDKLRSSIDALSELPLARRTHALERAINMAEADGTLAAAEIELIRELASAWDIVGKLDALTAGAEAAETQIASWSLLHDIGMLYVALAHGADGDLSAKEAEAMAVRLHAWQPKWPVKDVNRVLREVLQIYGGGEVVVRKSVAAVSRKLPPALRILLLEDLMVIADADGKTTEHERAIIWNLSRAWGIGRSAQ